MTIDVLQAVCRLRDSLRRVAREGNSKASRLASSLLEDAAATASLAPTLEAAAQYDRLVAAPGAPGMRPELVDAAWALGVEQVLEVLDQGGELLVIQGRAALRRPDGSTRLGPVV